jgi:hypothetical protein
MTIQSLYSTISGGDGFFMAIFQTIDPLQASRCEKSMRGKKITETFDTAGGLATITGRIQSVSLDLQSSPKRWTIAILSEGPHEWFSDFWQKPVA